MNFCEYIINIFLPLRKVSTFPQKEKYLHIKIKKIIIKTKWRFNLVPNNFFEVQFSLGIVKFKLAIDFFKLDTNLPIQTRYFFCDILFSTLSFGFAVEGKD